MYTSHHIKANRWKYVRANKMKALPIAWTRCNFDRPEHLTPNIALAPTKRIALNIYKCSRQMGVFIVLHLSSVCSATANSTKTLPMPMQTAITVGLMSFQCPERVEPIQFDAAGDRPAKLVCLNCNHHHQHSQTGRPVGVTLTILIGKALLVWIEFTRVLASVFLLKLCVCSCSPTTHVYSDHHPQCALFPTLCGMPESCYHFNWIY